MCNLLVIERENIDLTHYVGAGCTCFLENHPEKHAFKGDCNALPRLKNPVTIPASGSLLASADLTEKMRDRTFEALGREVYRHLRKKAKQEHRKRGEWVKITVDFEV